MGSVPLPPLSSFPTRTGDCIGVLAGVEAGVWLGVGVGVGADISAWIANKSNILWVYRSLFNISPQPHPPPPPLPAPPPQKSPSLSFSLHGADIRLLLFFDDTHVKERVFSNQPKTDIYCRYVDDTFVKTDSPEKVEELRRCFKEYSALRFTSESSDNGHLPFLDVKVSQGSDNKFSTEVYRKSTNLGLGLNGESECPERYKKSAISAYIRRALTHCSTWPSTTKEFENATQILVNNGFSNKDINNTIRKAVDKWYMDSDDDDRPQEKDLIKIFYKNQFHAKYKEDERALRTIIQEQVKPVNINSEINLVIYYKNRKSANLILKNSPTSNSDMLKKRNVVYAYTCPHERCSQQYIGMTTMRLSKRISCHAQEGAIYNHTRSNHNAKIKREEIIKNIKIIDTNSDSKRLRYLEALHILEKKPLMNCPEEPLLLPTTLPANHN